mgnify:CR=1 FL=1
MSSNRSETSFPEQSTETSVSKIEKSLPVIATKSYIPRANDLVVAIPRASEATNLHIPSSFMQNEAVDSSLLLGHGASFTVTRQAVPEGPKTMIDRLDIGKFITLKMPYQTRRRPKYVVYKSPRIEFKASGEPATPQDRRALESVLTEFHALLHPPLLRHPNIIDILGVAWGSNQANPLQQLPVLMVEYGDRGTLADVQLTGNPLSNEVKSQIALGIASGLQALHNESIVHGDLKPDNIIMCFNEEQGLIPKLGDFGFAIIEATEAPTVMLGGTRTWRAPESYSRLAIPMLKYTDVYSFGLVVWSIALDGRDPFSVLIPASMHLEDRFLALDRLKADDKVRDLSKFENWVPSWQKSKTNRSYKASTDDALAPTCTDNPSVHEFDETAKDATCISLRHQPFFSSLEDVLNSTLSLRPEKRDLSRAIDLLGQGTVADIST